MKRFLMVTGVVLSLGSLGACANNSSGFNKQSAGSILGGVGGAVAGAQFGSGTGRLAATAAGTLLGAFLGSEVGASLDKADTNYATQAGQRAFETTPTGQSVAWNNPDNGNYGSVTPIRTYEQGGQYCREYQQNITVGGQTQQSFGNACRQPDGSWKIIN